MLKASLDFDVSSSVKKGLEFLNTPTPEAKENEKVDEPEIIKENNQQENSSPSSSAENNYTEQDYDDSAESIIWVVDTLQQFILTIFAKRKLKKRAVEIAGENAMQKLREIKDKIKKEGTILLDVVESQLRDLNDEVEQFIDGLNLTEFEKQQVLEPFKKLAREKKFVLTPMQRIAIAAAMVIVPRLYVLRDI